MFIPTQYTVVYISIVSKSAVSVPLLILRNKSRTDHGMGMHNTGVHDVGVPYVGVHGGSVHGADVPGVSMNKTTFFSSKTIIFDAYLRNKNLIFNILCSKTTLLTHPERKTYRRKTLFISVNFVRHFL
jgi:hypothetical protein